MSHAKSKLKFEWYALLKDALKTIGMETQVEMDFFFPYGTRNHATVGKASSFAQMEQYMLAKRDAGWKTNATIDPAMMDTDETQ